MKVLEHICEAVAGGVVAILSVVVMVAVFIVIAIPNIARYEHIRHM